MAALCAIALTILVIDRLQLGSGQLGPETARASIVPVEITPTEADAMPELPEATSLSRSRNELASRLESMAAGQQDLADEPIRDVFQPSETWLARLGVRSSKPTVAAAPKEASFISRHRLQAVLVGKDGSSAIVNSTYLKIGQELDGFTLVSINANSASFVRGKERVMLTLGDSTAAGRIR